MITKKCKTCKTTKFLSDYHKEKTGLFGVKGTCKACRLAFYSNWNKLPEVKVHRAKYTKWYAQENKEVLAAKRKVYKAANKERFRVKNNEYVRRYYAKNLEKMRARYRDYYHKYKNKLKET